MKSYIFISSRTLNMWKLKQEIIHNYLRFSIFHFLFFSGTGIKNFQKFSETVFWRCLFNSFSLNFMIVFFLILTIKVANHLKPSQSTRNHANLSETTQKSPEIIQNHPIILETNPQVTKINYN